MYLNAYLTQPLERLGGTPHTQNANQTQFYFLNLMQFPISFSGKVASTSAARPPLLCPPLSDPPSYPILPTSLSFSRKARQHNPWEEGISGHSDIQRTEKADTKYRLFLKQTSPWISAAHQKPMSTCRVGGRRVIVSVRLSCLSYSPLLPKQTLISHSKIYAPNAQSNTPIDFLVASHYQDLLIAPAPH